MSQHSSYTPSDNWADGSTRQRDKTAWLPAMLVGALIFGIGCGSGLIAGWFAGTANSIAGLLDDFDLDAKITVKSTTTPAAHGEPMLVAIIVTDTSGTDRTIVEIDTSGSLFDNSDIVSIVPASNRTEDYETFVEHGFNTPLLANQSTEFVFEIIPKQAGMYRADFTVYMEDYNSESVLVSVEVLPAE